MAKNIKSVILGINPSHNTSAAIMVDDKIVAAVQEERFSRKKNHIGLPFKSIEFCLKVAGVKPHQLTSVVVASKTLFYLSALQDAGLAKPAHLATLDSIYHFLRFNVLHKLAKSVPKLGLLDYYLTLFLNHFVEPTFRGKFSKLLSDYCQIDPEIVTFIHHHLAHAATAYYGSGFAQDKIPTLIFTADGGGDDLAATVWLGRGPTMKLVSKTAVFSTLAYMYMYTTYYLGLKPVEDEYKVMGLAPYAPKNKVPEIYKKLEKFIEVDKKTLQFKSSVTTNIFYQYLPEIFSRVRFDVIAASIQELVEKKSCEWIGAALKKYRTDRLTTGGGLFANVKINQKVANLPQVKQAFFAPSPGDESNCFGACFAAFAQLFPNRTPKPLTDLYLGPEYSNSKLAPTIVRAKKLGYGVEEPEDINLEVAKLISEGKIVARFAGKLEFGARALGNRSILADASRLEVKDEINKMIKSRDFWMPFAPSILEEAQQKYLVNPKNFPAPFMILAFDTKPAAHKDLAAAIHPYDKTARHQIVSKSQNPKFHDLLTKFDALTGRGGLLNTSFNLHGEPIVCTPDDAIKTFKNSGLRFLQLENFLIEKLGENGKTFE